MKQHKSALSNTKLLQDIKTLPLADLSEQYSVHIDDDGTVWDTVEDIRFKDIKEWAEYLTDMEDDSQYAGFSKMGGKKYFDDGQTIKPIR
jgi:hypothetical protein